MAVLAVENLRVQVRTPDGPADILTGIDLTVPEGDSVGLVGESGCGKSMTALAIMGLLPAGARAEGSVRLQGRELLGLSERAVCRWRGRHMAMVFQEPMAALNPLQTIGAQITEGLRLHFGVTGREAGERARAMLDRVGLPPDRFPPSLYPHQLSGGQRQRVVIAIALICEPALLIADEPTTALDVTIQAQILDLLTGLCAELGTALVLITHDLGVVAETCRRMAVMYSGAVVETGDTADVFARMAHPYTRGLLGAMPQAVDDLGHRVHRLSTIPGVVPDPRERPPGCPFQARCPRATATCRETPPTRDLGRGHAVWCVHPHADAELSR